MCAEIAVLHSNVGVNFGGSMPRKLFVSDEL